jgi:serine/threonine-protein kinase
MREADHLRRLAARLAGDDPIDWDVQEQAAATDSERDAIRELRIVAAMVGFHRAAQAGDPNVDLAASVSAARSMLNASDTSAAPSVRPTLAPGSRWGHLEIQERVGRGAFGDVYRARDTRLDRIVALKLLGPDTTAALDEVVREAGLLAKVRHPNVVTVFGADRIDGRVGIWMEFLQGETLDRMLQARGVLDAREAALVGIDVCRALSAVHAAGIVHQDVKLGNVMRADGGRIVLMDFGLGHETRPRTDGKLTSIAGTPLFMAPEVLRGTPADARSDVYSLGVVLFALVTNTFPVQATRAAELLDQHDRGAMRRARDLRPDLPESFAHVLDRLLAPDPGSRFASPGEAEHALLQTLGAAAPGAPAIQRPGAARRWTWAAVAAALALATLTALGVRPARRTPSGAVTARAIPLAELPSMTLTGEAAYDLFGHNTAAVGDVDRDGFDDVLIAAPQHAAGGANRGKVYLYRGASAGLETQPSWTATGTVDQQHFGYSLAAATNVLDGLTDVIVGAPGSAHAGDVGRVFVFGGTRDGLSHEPVQTLTVDRVGTSFGYAVATGDVNHDGADDLLVGEPFALETHNGRAFLYLSKDGSFAREPAWSATGPAGSWFGLDLSLGGDVNHDGYADAVIGAPNASLGPDLVECGAAYVYMGSAVGLDSIPSILPGCQAGGHFGRDAAFAGDLDADGFSDVVIGAEFASNGEQNEGVVQLCFGSKTGVAPYGAVFLESNTMGANFGICAASLHDLDGDGCDDLFVGALRFQRHHPREGAAFVYLGSRDRRIAPGWSRVRGKPGSWLGGGGGPAGDVNADGFPDFIVGAPSFDTETGTNVGQVELFLNTRR